MDYPGGDGDPGDFGLSVLQHRIFAVSGAVSVQRNYPVRYWDNTGCGQMAAIVIGTIQHSTLVDHRRSPAARAARRLPDSAGDRATAQAVNEQFRDFLRHSILNLID